MDCPSEIAVLQDEKAMAVLNTVHGEWVLFWVLEIVGLSIALAVFAVKVTGNTDAVDEHDQAGRCKRWTERGCGIFNWGFVLTDQPIAVTVCAFLLTSVISRPTSSFPGRTLIPRSMKQFGITTLMLCWVVQVNLGLVNEYMSIIFDTVVGVLAWFIVAVHFRRELACINRVRTLCRGDFQGGYCLLWFGGVVISLGFILSVALVVISSENSETVHSEDCLLCFEILGVVSAVLYLSIYVWLINGIRLYNKCSADVGHTTTPAHFLRLMPIGWMLSEGFYAAQYWIFWISSSIVYIYPNSSYGINFVGELSWLVWYLLVGTTLRGGADRARVIAYWIAATLIRNVFVSCVATWVFAVAHKAVK